MPRLDCAPLWSANVAWVSVDLEPGSQSSSLFSYTFANRFQHTFGLPISRIQRSHASNKICFQFRGLFRPLYVSGKGTCTSIIHIRLHVLPMCTAWHAVTIGFDRRNVSHRSPLTANAGLWSFALPWFHEITSLTGTQGCLFLERQPPLSTAMQYFNVGQDHVFSFIPLFLFLTPEHGLKYSS